MKKTILALILLSVFCHFGVQAQDITQNQNLDNALASMFQSLELDRVQTGFLLDRAIEAIYIRNFDGTLTSDNYVDQAAFRNTLITLNLARVNSNATSIDGSYETNSLVRSVVK